MKTLRDQLARHDVDLAAPTELSPGEIDAVSGGDLQARAPDDVRWFAKAVIVIRF